MCFLYFFVSGEVFTSEDILVFHIVFKRLEEIGACSSAEIHIFQKN